MDYMMEGAKRMETEEMKHLRPRHRHIHHRGQLMEVDLNILQDFHQDLRQTMDNS